MIELENFTEACKKLQQISLEPQNIGVAADAYHHGISEGALGTHPFRSAPSVASGLVTEGSISVEDQVDVKSSEGQEYDENVPEPGYQPVMVKVGRMVDGYARIREWADPVVATVAAGWIGLVRNPRRREILERYGWVLGVVVVTLSAALVGWWVQEVGRVPEGFVERGSPQWFRSRLHHGRRGWDGR